MKTEREQQEGTKFIIVYTDIAVQVEMRKRGVKPSSKRHESQTKITRPQGASMRLE